MISWFSHIKQFSENHSTIWDVSSLNGTEIKTKDKINFSVDALTKKQRMCGITLFCLGIILLGVGAASLGGANFLAIKAAKILVGTGLGVATLACVAASAVRLLFLKNVNAFMRDNNESGDYWSNKFWSYKGGYVYSDSNYGPFWIKQHRTYEGGKDCYHLEIRTE